MPYAARVVSMRAHRPGGGRDPDLRLGGELQRAFFRIRDWGATRPCLFVRDRVEPLPQTGRGAVCLVCSDALY